MRSFDQIVIGGGHNGLVCAAFLARSGRKVLVLEAADEPGGAARTEEFAPGFHVSLAHLLNRLHPDVVTGLDLKRHGLALDETPAPSVALSADGTPLVLHGAYGEALSGADAVAEQQAWKELRARLLRHAGILKPFLSHRPPDLGGMNLSDSAFFGKAALALRRLGKQDMRDFLRMLLMNVADVLDESLSDDRLKGLLAFDAVLGSHLGPRSPTSLLGLYWRLAGDAGGVPGAQTLPKGGMGSVIAAILAAARAADAEVRVGARVGRILVEKGETSGVMLADGEEIRARSVISAIDPKKTFIELVGPRELDTGFVRKTGNIRMDGDVAKLHLALDRPPDFAGVDAQGQRGRLVIAPSVDAVENAFNPAKYGELADRPVMEITLPSLSDPTLAPEGACVLSANVQFAPYAVRGGWEKARPKFLKTIITQLEAHAPGIGATVRHAELLTPADIEARYGMTGGHWHHGELQADQMLMNRPFHGAAGYDMPIAGLYLASAGAHPGGGISGAPGMNAARRVIETGG